MKNEEAINHLTDMYKYSGLVGLDREDRIALSKGIEALEQEPILDKIRAEINRQEKWLLQAGYTAYNVDIAFDAIKAVLAESEVEE